MIEHIDNIEKIYGKAYVQIPNGIFRDLSESIKSRSKTNIQQVSFSYSYLIINAFLYKYAHYVDVDNGTYLQNSDLKQILGYDKTTKTIDKVIKKNGILEEMGLVSSTKSFPVSVVYTHEMENGIKFREFILSETMDKSSDEYKSIKSIVKNRNYEIREPRFLFEYKGEVGSLYDYSNTHRVNIKEFLTLLKGEQFDNIDTMLYFYFKSKCYGLKYNKKSIPLSIIAKDLSIGQDSYYVRLERLEKSNYISAKRKGWKVLQPHEIQAEANDYTFKGIR